MQKIGEDTGHPPAEQLLLAAGSVDSENVDRYARGPQIRDQVFVSQGIFGVIGTDLE